MQLVDEGADFFFSTTSYLIYQGKRYELKRIHGLLILDLDQPLVALAPTPSPPIISHTEEEESPEENSFPEACALLAPAASVARWHARLGHVHKDRIRALQKSGTAIGLNITGQGAHSAKCRCEACAKTNNVSRSIPKIRDFSTNVSQKGQLLTTDILGPFPPSPEGYRYAISFVDEFTRFSHVYFLKRKSEAPNALTLLIAEYRKNNSTISEIRSDQGGEYGGYGDHTTASHLLQQTRRKKQHTENYVSDAFLKVCRKNQITHSLAPAYRHELNGVAERWNRTVRTMGNAMLYKARISPILWSSAIAHANFLRNRLPAQSRQGHTPYELFYNRYPNYDNLRTWGCYCYKKIPGTTKTPGLPTRKRLIYVGDTANRIGFRCFDPIEFRYTTEFELIFDEEGLDHRAEFLEAYDERRKLAEEGRYSDIPIVSQAKPNEHERSIYLPSDTPSGGPLGAEELVNGPHEPISYDNSSQDFKQPIPGEEPVPASVQKPPSHCDYSTCIDADGVRKPMHLGVCEYIPQSTPSQDLVSSYTNSSSKQQPPSGQVSTSSSRSQPCPTAASDNGKESATTKDAPSSVITPTPSGERTSVERKVTSNRRSPRFLPENNQTVTALRVQASQLSSKEAGDAPLSDPALVHSDTDSVSTTADNTEALASAPQYELGPSAPTTTKVAGTGIRAALSAAPFNPEGAKAIMYTGTEFHLEIDSEAEAYGPLTSRYIDNVISQFEFDFSDKSHPLCPHRRLPLGQVEEESPEISKFLKLAKQLNLELKVQQSNPKQPRTKSFLRYEVTKSATTVQNYLSLHSSNGYTHKGHSDLVWDYCRGYITFPNNTVSSALSSIDSYAFALSYDFDDKSNLNDIDTPFTKYEQFQTLLQSMWPDDPSPTIDQQFAHERKWHECFTAMSTTGSPEPTGYKQAIHPSHPERQFWLEAIKKELSTLVDRQTWSYVPKSYCYRNGQKKHPIRCKFVFRKKTVKDGSIQYKARLVACGYSQKPGLDYSSDELYASVCSYSSM